MEGPRPVKPEEFASLDKLIDSTFTGYPRGMRQAYPLLFDYRNSENLWVFVEDGRVISHVGIRPDEVLIFGARMKIASVGSVGTYPEYRGQGLASRLLEAAQAKADHDGAAVINISGSRGLYQRFGAVKVGRSGIYNIPAGDAAEGLFIQQAESQDVFKLERIYEREPVRYHRPLEDWMAAFKAMDNGSESHQSVVYLFGDADYASGYVLIRHGKWRDKVYARVEEWAGYRKHIVGALPAVAAAEGLESIELRVPDHDPSLARAAEATGLPHTVDFLTNHTIKVSSLANFTRAIKPYMEERLGRSGAGGVAFQMGAGGTYDVIIGEEHVPFDVPAFTSLAFGNPERDDLEGVGFGGGLLGRIFPVPLPLAGFNYV